MGIYDRDYIRRAPRPSGPPGRGGLAAVRTWSLNTWIIVICVAVFVIDGFLPHRWVPIATQSLIEPDDLAAIDPSARLVDPQVVVTGRSARGEPVLGYRSVYLDTAGVRLRVGGPSSDTGNAGGGTSATEAGCLAAIPPGPGRTGRGRGAHAGSTTRFQGARCPGASMPR